jgi:hypothetical protein
MKHLLALTRAEPDCWCLTTRVSVGPNGDLGGHKRADDDAMPAAEGASSKPNIGRFNANTLVVSFGKPGEV